MFDVTQLFVASAWAQSSSPSPSGGAEGMNLMQFVPFFLIFAVVYVLMIRPQQKRIDDQNKMVKALRRGDRVITLGGIFGKISRLEGEDIVYLEVADGINVKVLRSQIGGLEAKTDPAITSDNSDQAETKK